MSRYNSNFREPPWVMGSPKEVMDWMDATNPKKKDKIDDSFSKKYLNNLHVKFDFDVKHKLVENKGFFSGILNKNLVEEDFNLIKSAEIILRGLAKAKFHNTSKIIVDGETIYDHPEKKTDLKKTIDVIDDYLDVLKDGKSAEINAILDDIEKCVAIVKIRKIHQIGEHSVDIQIKGKIRKEIYHTFLNYLKDKIGFKDG